MPPLAILDCQRQIPQPTALVLHVTCWALCTDPQAEILAKRMHVEQLCNAQQESALS